MIRAVCFDLDGTLLRDDHVDGVVRRAAAELAALHAGVDADALADAVARHAALEQAAFRLYDESLEVIAELRSRGIRVALITNGPSELQRGKLRDTGIGDVFDAVVVSGEHSVSKPDGEIFARALAELGVDAAEALHVGDNPLADVAGAKDAGLTAVWIRRGEDESSDPGRADAVIGDLRELLPLLDEG